MKEFDFSKVEHVHCIGIGGVGISALARLLIYNGKKVSGTNDGPSPLTLSGIDNISFELDPKKLPLADLYIYSDAWLTNNPHILEEARSRGITTLSYFEALGLIARDYKVIAVSGTHGKTTTTSMLADVLEAGGIDPTVVVGSIRKKTNSNFQAGKSKYFLVEADEYLRHFWNFYPEILIILNIDLDHLDYYKDLDDIKSAFRVLASRVPKSGLIVADLSQENIKEVVKGLEPKIIDYTKIENIKLKISGRHNVLNAKAVYVVASFLNLDSDLIIKTLFDFEGTARRCQYLGKHTKGFMVYDDYAHHPAEIKATLSGLRDFYQTKKITVVFQPHLYSRTKLLLNDFADCFEAADQVIILPIYAAREIPDPAIDHHILSAEIAKKHKQVLVMDDFATTVDYLINNLDQDDLIVSMGAGNVVDITSSLV